MKVEVANKISSKQISLLVVLFVDQSAIYCACVILVGGEVLGTSMGTRLEIRPITHEVRPGNTQESMHS